MKTFILTLTFFLPLSCSFAHQTVYEQLCDFNPNWKKYPNYVSNAPAQTFKHDWQLVQFHLFNVLNVLESADLTHLSQFEKENRFRLIAELRDYSITGKFPVNYISEKRTPVFIDEDKTHCAVGYLLKQSGYADIAREIADQQNLAWVPEIQSNELFKLQKYSGLSIEEIKLIQGAYDFYAPGALTAYNKYEIPQQPQVIDRKFDEKRYSRFNRKSGQWLYGEEKNGILHGKWIQNYSADLPWIVGFYSHGKRTGQWKEYYKGTDILCRTEYWRNDKLNGIRTRYDRQGNIIETIQFKDGEAVLKTNYENHNGLKWVRKPLMGDTVYTQVFDDKGALIAAGKETIYNPGNLEWFQNIELTALNTMAIQARDQVSSNGVRESQFQSFTPLVEYHKRGDWEYYASWQPEQISANEYTIQSIIKSYYSNFWRDFLNVSNRFNAENLSSHFDSLHVTYKNNQIEQFHGYGDRTEKHYLLVYYDNATNIGYQFQPAEMDIHRILQHSSYGQSTPVYIPPAINRVKAYGEITPNGAKTGKWVFLDRIGNKLKETVYFVPEPIDMPAVKVKSVDQLAIGD
jgi:antitoxin component YwqK of YwqJK toxin-antitoxin module